MGNEAQSIEERGPSGSSGDWKPLKMAGNTPSPRFNAWRKATFEFLPSASATKIVVNYELQ